MGVRCSGFSGQHADQRGPPKVLAAFGQIGLAGAQLDDV